MSFCVVFRTQSVVRCASRVRAELEFALRGVREAREGMRILGPAPLAILKVSNNYRYRVTLCAPPGSGMRRVLADTVMKFSADKRYRGVAVYADTNPSD